MTLRSAPCVSRTLQSCCGDDRRVATTQNENGPASNVHERFEPETLCSFDLLAAESRRLSPSQDVGRLGRNGNKHAVARGVVSLRIAPVSSRAKFKRIMGLAKRNQKGRLLTGPSITPAHSAAAVYLRSE
jgi:hypothetical protein